MFFPSKRIKTYYFSLKIQRPSPLYLLIGIVSLLFSCSDLNRLKDCQKLAEITSDLAREANMNLMEKDESKIVIIQKKFAVTSRIIKEEDWQDLTIKEYSNTLAETYQNYENLSQKFLTAFRQKQREEAFSIQRELAELGSKQIDLVANINNYCGEK